ncbi:MAG: site-specific DNA-methyltransferase [Burkholderiales bacterium]|nr:site-specific DNA-methyltransferase [Burkholderiales bacterium]
MPEIVFKGKEYVYNHHLTVPYRPLVADAAKGIGPADLSGNLIIHGDNLHALKSLLPRYAGAVDLIFIDPPYNTGNEGWCYSDGVNSPIMKEWLSTNPVDGEDMLRHDKWLCMMWPRLVLLRELLSERGSIWITLDDNEVHRARMVLDEIFGDENFVNCFAWRKVDSPNDNKVAVTPDHDYVLCYSKDKSQVQFSPMLALGILDAYGSKDATGRAYRDRLLKKNGKNSLRTDRPTMYFAIPDPDGNDVYPMHDNGEEACWAAGPKGVEAHLQAGTLIWKRKEKFGQQVWEPYTREYAPDIPTRPYPTIWADLPTMRQSKAMLRDIFGTVDVFDTPKPVELIERIMDLVNQPDALILDSFAGSGTTAHAVLKANAKDGGQRKFILVEGEDYADKLTAERVRRAIQGYAWSGTQREILLEEKITLTQFKKADDWLKKIDAIKRAEGLADEADKGADLVEQAQASATSKRKRFDKIESRIDDGVLRVEGVRRVSQMADGLGGEFTYCTLGEAVELDKLLSGERLPAFEALGAWLFYTATGGTLQPLPKNAPPHYLGEAQDKHVWLIYQPDLRFLKSADAALILSRAQAMQQWGHDHDVARGQPPKGHLVFAPAKYLSNKQLKDHGMDYAPLPFALYREC